MPAGPVTPRTKTVLGFVSDIMDRPNRDNGHDVNFKALVDGLFIYIDDKEEEFWACSVRDCVGL